MHDRTTSAITNEITAGHDTLSEEQVAGSRSRIRRRSVRGLWRNCGGRRRAQRGLIVGAGQYCERK